MMNQQKAKQLYKKGLEESEEGLKINKTRKG